MRSTEQYADSRLEASIACVFLIEVNHDTQPMTAESFLQLSFQLSSESSLDPGFRRPALMPHHQGSKSLPLAVPPPHLCRNFPEAQSDIHHCCTTTERQVTYSSRANFFLASCRATIPGDSDHKQTWPQDQEDQMSR